jgi:hypothetical protein
MLDAAASCDAPEQLIEPKPAIASLSSCFLALYIVARARAGLIRALCRLSFLNLEDFKFWLE